MKHFANALAVFALSILFVSCDDSSNYMGSDWQLSANTRYLALDRSEVSFGADQNLSQNIKVSSISTGWRLTGGDAWVSASQSSGNSDAEVTLTATENKSADDIRTCIFNLSSTEADFASTYPISVTQSCATPYIAPNTQTLQFTRDASSQHVDIDANSKWVAKTAADWITVTTDKDNAGLTISVKENESTKDRNATVEINGKTKATISVHQSGTQFDNLIGSLHFGNKADSKSITIETDGRWTATTNKNWISFSSATGSGTTPLVITVSDNSDENERDGVITVSVGDVSKQILVVQSGTYINVVPPSDIAIPSRGGSHSVSFSTSDDWSAYSNSSWVQLSPSSGSEGQNVLTIQASDNPSAKERYDTTYIMSSNPHLQTIRIITKQAGRYLNVSAENVSFESKGGTTTITIDSDDNWKVSSCPEWITISEMRGSESKTISVVISEFPETRREGTIVIESDFCGSKAIDIVQTCDNYQPWLSFTSDGPQTLQFTYEVPTLEYSVNGSEWQELGTKKVAFGGNQGELRLRGKSSYGTIEKATFYENELDSIKFGTEHKVACRGDIRTLVDYQNYNYADSKNARFSGLFKGCHQLIEAPELPATTLASYCYCDMFSHCSSLTSSPILPATTLAGACYTNMFNGCSSLTSAPNLPAMTLADHCYWGMFEGCSSLTSAPNLPATTLVYRCYARMFRGCSSLTSAPSLPATTLAEECYYLMFSKCSSLTCAPSLPATTLAKECYSDMFDGCSSLTSAPSLPAMTLAEMCYSAMFYGCSSLTSAPDLPSTTLEDGCYAYMFSYCRSLTRASNLPATTLTESCYEAMFYGCSSLTIAPSLPAMTLAARCYRFMFSGCSSLKKAPDLPATTLADDCYSSMFGECSSLTNAPNLPSTTLEDGCYAWMFKNCSSLTNAPNLPATTLAKSCYYHMFWGCSSMKSAPDLPAITLEPYCYSEMFSYCYELNKIKMMATDISAEDCLKDWTRYVSKSGTFIKNAAATWDESAVVPYGWTVAYEDK